jgi:hypothetical protein
MPETFSCPKTALDSLMVFDGIKCDAIPTSVCVLWDGNETCQPFQRQVFTGLRW